MVGQVIVSEEGRADTFNRANRVEEWVRVEIMLRRAVGLEKVAVAAEDLIEIDLLTVRQHRAAADRRGAVDAAKCAGGGFRKRARCAGRHVDGAGLLVGDRKSTRLNSSH